MIILLDFLAVLQLWVTEYSLLGIAVIVVM